MTDTLARGSLTEPRVVRGPAYAVVTECLRIQSTARRQSRLAWLFGQSPVLADASGWYRGALGELEVSRTLRGLGPEWTVLYSVDAAREASDLIIGPAGVFTIVTKNHSRQRVWLEDDQLRVNGRRTNHIRDARHEARRISHLLGIVVTPIIAVIDPATLTLKERADGVEVLASSQLAGYLARRKARLTDDAVAALVVTAALDGTWDAHVVDETDRYAAPFARLKADVDAAWRRRVGWVVGVGAVTLLLFAAMIVV